MEIIRNLINYKEKKMTGNMKEKVVIISFTILFILDIAAGTKIWVIPFRWVSLCTIMIIGILALLYYNFEKDRLSVSKISILIWYTTWGFFFVSTILNSINYIPIPLVTMFVLPIFYKCFPENQIDNFFQLLTKSAIYIFTIFVICSLLFRPFIGRAYVGIFTNANYMGQFVTIILVILLANISLSDNEKPKLYKYILLGFVYSFGLLSLSRTAWLTMFVVTVVWFAVQIYIGKKAKLKRLIRISLKIVGAFIITSALIFALGFVLFDESGLSKIGLPQLEADGFELLSDENEITLKSRIMATSYRLEDNIPTDETNIEEYSSGRIHIWKAYIKDLSVLGKATEDRPIIDKTGKQAGNAHSTFFEVSHIGGVIAALGFIIINLWLVIKSLACCYRFNGEKKYVYTLLVSLAVIITGVFAGVYSPIGQMIGVAYFFAFLPLIKNSEKSRNNGEI